MKLSHGPITALFLLGTTLVARAAPLTATPWTLAASTGAQLQMFGIGTGGASGGLAIDNTGPGRIMVKVETPPPPAPPGRKPGAARVAVFLLKPGESIGRIGVPAGGVIHVIDCREIPTSGPQVGSSGTYCWSSP